MGFWIYNLYTYLYTYIYIIYKTELLSLVNNHTNLQKTLFRTVFISVIINFYQIKTYI